MRERIALQCLPHRAHSYYYGWGVLKKPDRRRLRKFGEGAQDLESTFTFSWRTKCKNIVDYSFPHLAGHLEVRLQFYTIIITYY